MSWLRKAKRPTIVYTDGSCLNVTGEGGWAAIVLKDGKETVLYGAESQTTNNRMELMAVIRALESLPDRSNVYLFTDSQYVQKGILYWVHGWKQRNWKTGTNQEVANRDLWEMMDEQSQRHLVSWHWVKGHDGDELNERCDALAALARINGTFSEPTLPPTGEIT